MKINRYIDLSDIAHLKFPVITNFEMTRIIEEIEPNLEIKENYKDRLKKKYNLK